MINRKGFTLFELLVAMIIFSIIVGFAIPTFRLYQREAIRIQIDGDIKLLNAAVKVYYGQHQQYPPVKDYLTQLVALSPKIIAQPPYDPFSDTGKSPYIYKLSANKKFFLIYSVGTLGNTEAAVSAAGKIRFLKGDPRFDKFISNGSL